MIILQCAKFNTTEAVCIQCNLNFVKSTHCFDVFYFTEKEISWFGKEALFVYLLYMFVIKEVNQPCGEFAPDMLGCLLISAIVFALCCMIGKVLKRIPVINWFVKM